jgi:DNA-binding GntR family transcriptional regulator
VSPETGIEVNGEAGRFASLPPIVTVHAYDHVYRLLRHSIVSRSMVPGTRAVEAALAEQLHVSRTPVRDALRRLEGDGLLVRRNGGLEVVDISTEEIDDIFRVRGELDRLAARLACERGVEADWRELRLLVDALAPAIGNFGISSYEFSQAHEAVHAAIYRIAFAPIVASMLSDRLLGLVDIAEELSYTADGPEEPVVAQHVELVDALSGGNVERAMAAADRHCREAEEAARAGAGYRAAAQREAR